jgi:hypothetical protein
MQGELSIYAFTTKRHCESVKTIFDALGVKYNESAKFEPGYASIPVEWYGDAVTYALQDMTMCGYLHLKFLGNEQH